MEVLFAQMSVCDTVALEVVSGYIIVYDHRGEEMFCHNLRYLQKLAGGLDNKITGEDFLCFSVISSNKAGVFYVLKESKRAQVRCGCCRLDAKCHSCRVKIMSDPTNASSSFSSQCHR